MTPFYSTYRSILEQAVHSSEEQNQRTGARIRVVRGGMSFTTHLQDRILPTIGYRKTFPRSAAAEVAWFLMGMRSIAFIQKYAPLWNKFVEELGANDFGVRAAYGYRWRSHFGRDQLQLAMDALHKDPSDRRCYIAAWDPGEDGLGQKGQRNVPCPVGFSLTISHGELHSTLTLRSCDVFVGLPYDVMGHALLMAAIANELNIIPGIMHVALAHVHLYEQHWSMAEETLLQSPVSPRLSLPGWTVSQIVASPDAYIVRYSEAAKEHMWPSFNPRPHVVE